MIFLMKTSKLGNKLALKITLPIEDKKENKNSKSDHKKTKLRGSKNLKKL